MLESLAIIAVVILLCVLYWRMLKDELADVRRKDAAGPSRGANIKDGQPDGDGAVLIPADSAQAQPVVVAGRIHKWLGGSGISIGSTGRKRLRVGTNRPYGDASDAAQHKKIDDYVEGQQKHIVPVAMMKSLIDTTDEAWRPFMITACYTGMKVSELFGLMWEDVDFKGSKIRVHRTYFHGRFHDPEPVTLKRSIIVPPEVIEVLKEHQKNQEANKIQSSHYFVFTNSVGDPLELRSLLNNMFIPLVSRMNMDYLKFGDLRYSYATALAAAGEQADFIRKQLGDPTIDKAVYSESLPKGVEKAVGKKLSSIFRLSAAQPEEAA
ncbi:MAG TPA: tyrosine-type recombinase/integrase [Candidatus Aquicultor sp.]